MADPTPDLDAVIAELETYTGEGHLDEENDAPECLRCHELYTLDGGKELTPLCDLCAHEVVAGLSRLLSAARLAQKLTELLGPEPVRKAEELLGDSAALRELREDLQLFMDDNHLKFEEAANLAHSRGIELERLRERLAAAEEVCDAALEIRDGGGTLLPELLAVLKTWADREGERVARQFAELRKP